MATFAVEVVNLRKSFDRAEVLRGVSFRLDKGETLVVMGGSGSGKTVLLRHVAGLVRPDAGEGRVFGRNIQRLSGEGPLPLRRRMGYVFQGAALFDSLSVHDNVALPLREHTSPSAGEIHDRELARTVADRLAILMDGRFATVGRPDEVMTSGEPAVQAFLAGEAR